MRISPPHLVVVLYLRRWIPADLCFPANAQSFGIAIGGTILQNVLLHDLPPSFVQTLPQGVEIAYAIIPTIPTLEAAFKDQVRDAFARATQLIWRVMLGISGAGLLSCLLMKEIELRTDMDEKWGLQEREKNKVPSLENGKELDVAEGASEPK